MTLVEKIRHFSLPLQKSFTEINLWSKILTCKHIQMINCRQKHLELLNLSKCYIFALFLRFIFPYIESRNCLRFPVAKVTIKIHSSSLTMTSFDRLGTYTRDFLLVFRDMYSLCRFRSSRSRDCFMLSVYLMPPMIMTGLLPHV